MKHELVFHGVPRGHQVWGGTLDKYYETFYGSEEIYKSVYKGVKSLMILEIRKFEEKYFSYYTFINYKNVNAQDGRPGSYFAMTFKVDGHYCTAVHCLYDLLSQVYQKYVSSEILSVNGESQRYKIDSFEAISAKLTVATKVFTEQINTNFANDFEEISTNLVKKNADKIAYYNLNDVDSQAFFDSTLSYGQILISAEYLSKDARLEKLTAQVREANNDISSLNESKDKLEDQIKAIPVLQENLQDVKTKLNEQVELNEKYKKAYAVEKDKVSQLNLQNNELAQQINQLGSYKTAREIISCIEKPLCELAEIAKTDKRYMQMASVPPQEPAKKPFVLYSIIGLLLAMIIGLGVYTWVILPNSSKAENDAQSKAQAAQIDSLNQALNSEKEKYCELENKITEICKSFIRIDIQEYEGTGTMKVNQHFTARLKNLSDVSGEWRVDGFNIADRNNPKTSITVNKEGRVVISYYINGVKVATRGFDAEK